MMPGKYAHLMQVSGYKSACGLVGATVLARSRPQTPFHEQPLSAKKKAFNV